jgi:glucokinase
MEYQLILDVGGTKTHIVLISGLKDGSFERVKEAKYPTQKAKGIEEIIHNFQSDLSHVTAISIAVAGPVIGQKAQLTNVFWSIEINNIQQSTGIKRVYLLNDLEASAYGIPFMTKEDRLCIYDGSPNLPGNAALIAPGTGLGEAGMYWDGNHFHPFATEGGHSDFAPRDNKDVNLLIYLQHKYGHVSWERLVSGMGIVNIFDYLRTSVEYTLDPELEKEMITGDVAANVNQAAVKGEKIAVDTMKMFVRYMAIEAGNLALKLKSSGGLYIGGGIIPKIWNDEYQEIFLEHFFDVGRMEPLLRKMDVIIILNPQSVLFGAAQYMAERITH